LQSLTPRHLFVQHYDQLFEFAEQAASLTVNDYLHIIQKTMNDGQCLCHGHPGLFLRESVQSLEYRLDLAISQQLLCELLCNTSQVNGSGYNYSETVLTESSSTYLSFRHGKNCNQLNHDFRDNIRHQRIQCDPGINLETLEKVSEKLKEFEKGVVTRAHSISRLRSFEYNIRLTQRKIRPMKKEGTHGEEDIDSDEDETCRLERYLVEKA
jgi:hypothetical protein